jgi:hypothetical protein
VTAEILFTALGDEGGGEVVEILLNKNFKIYMLVVNIQRTMRRTSNEKSKEERRIDHVPTDPV